MKQFILERNKNYGIICNVAIRDKKLSLKAKGLYAFITQLPSEWDYTVKGLQAVLKEGYEAIQTALNELIQAGYLIRYQVRNEDGQMGGMVYIVKEHPETLAVNGKPDCGEVRTIEAKASNRKNKKTGTKKASTTKHFDSEREYSSEELDRLLDDIGAIDFG